MKWLPRELARVGRIACPWLTTRFVDPEAEFLFVPPARLPSITAREGGIPFDTTGVELTHYAEGYDALYGSCRWRGERSGRLEHAT